MYVFKQFNKFQNLLKNINTISIYSSYWLIDCVLSTGFEDAPYRIICLSWKEWNKTKKDNIQLLIGDVNTVNKND